MLGEHRWEVLDIHEIKELWNVYTKPLKSSLSNHITSCQIEIPIVGSHKTLLVMILLWLI